MDGHAPQRLGVVAAGGVALGGGRGAGHVAQEVLRGGGQILLEGLLDSAVGAQTGCVGEVQLRAGWCFSHAVGQGPFGVHGFAEERRQHEQRGDGPRRHTLEEMPDLVEAGGWGHW